MLITLKLPPIPQSAFRTPQLLLAFLGDGHVDIVAFFVELQDHLHGRDLVFVAEKDGLFARGEGVGIRGFGCPIPHTLQVQVIQAVLNQDFHRCNLTHAIGTQGALVTYQNH